MIISDVINHFQSEKMIFHEVILSLLREGGGTSMYVLPRLEYSWAKTFYTPKSKSKGTYQKNKDFGRKLGLVKRDISRSRSRKFLGILKQVY